VRDACCLVLGKTFSPSYGSLKAKSMETVKMKSNAEEAMTSAMEQISDRLPDFKIYRKIYPDPDLRLMLVKAYKDVIRFARAATSYFEGSTFGRQ
jgi:hypothetical protein